MFARKVGDKAGPVQGPSLLGAQSGALTHPFFTNGPKVCRGLG